MVHGEHQSFQRMRPEAMGRECTAGTSVTSRKPDGSTGQGHSLECPEAAKEQRELWSSPEFECPLNPLTRVCGDF